MNKGQKKTMSLKQLEANRNNGRKSNGPKTPEGKAKSSMNAVKHGILSKQVVVAGLCNQESLVEFQDLRDEFWQHLAPVGPLEKMLVDEIVTTYWRLRRALIAETGEIALSVDSGFWERLRVKAGKRARFENAWGILGESKLKLTVAGVDYMIEVLEHARGRVKEEGELTQDALDEVIKVFGPESSGAAFALFMINDTRENNPQGLDAAALKEKYQKLILGYIDWELEKFKRHRLILEAREVKEEAARQAAAVLPPAEKLDKNLRYETTLKRHLHRAMHQLERLQRMRKGEDIPAPMAMTI